MAHRISLPFAMQPPSLKRAEKRRANEKKPPSSPRSPRICRSESTHLEADAKVEVSAQCRTKEVVLKSLEELAASRGSLASRHAQLLGVTTKGMVSERRTFIKSLDALKVCASTAAACWALCEASRLDLEITTAAAETASELTAAGQSPSDAASSASQAAFRGKAALRNLLPKWRAKQQTRAREEAAKQAAERAAERARLLAEVAAESPRGDDKGSDASDATVPVDSCFFASPLQSQQQVLPDPGSAAAVASGAPLSKSLARMVASEEWVKCSAYLQARLDLIADSVRAEVRDICLRLWKLTEPLLRNADGDAKVVYLQLRADLCRYASQEARDAEGRERFRTQALSCYEQALTILKAKETEAEAAQHSRPGAQSTINKGQGEDEEEEEQEEEDVVLSGRIGVVLNYAVLLHDDPNRVEDAILLLAEEFKRAVKNVIHVKDAEESRRVVMAMGLLRDNVESWCRETGREDSVALLGLNDLASPLPF